MAITNKGSLNYPLPPKPFIDNHHGGLGNLRNHVRSSAKSVSTEIY